MGACRHKVIFLAALCCLASSLLLKESSPSFYCGGQDITHNGIKLPCLNNQAIEACDHTGVETLKVAQNLCGWTSLYLDRFLNQKSFSLARYNDGEWRAIAEGPHPGICSGNIDYLPCTEDLIRRLRDTINSPDLLTSTWSSEKMTGVADFDAVSFIYESSLDFASKALGLDKRYYKQQFHVVDVLHGLVREHPADFVAAMLAVSDKRRFQVTVVGPHWLKNLRGLLSIESFIEIPSKMNDASELQRTLEHIKDEVHHGLINLPLPSQGTGHPRAVFFFAASMMSNVVIAELFALAQQRGAFLIDVGSAFDPFLDDLRIARRVQREAVISKYANPSQAEISRLVVLLSHVEEKYQQFGLTPVFQVSEARANEYIQAWSKIRCSNEETFGPWTSWVKDSINDFERHQANAFQLAMKEAEERRAAAYARKMLWQKEQKHQEDPLVAV
jgi:hypothetical protein